VTTVRTLFSRLLVSYIALVIATLLLLGGALGIFYGRFEMHRRIAELTERGHRIAAFVVEEGLFDEGVPRLRSITPVLDTFDEVMNTRIWLADRHGLIRMTSTSQRQWRGVTLDWDDLKRLTQGEVIARETNLPFLGPGVSVAVPIPGDIEGTVIGAVILHAPLRGFWTNLRDAQALTIYAGLIAIGLATAMGYYFSLRISRPIEEMTASVKAMQQGDFEVRVDETPPGELRTLAQGFNSLAAQLGRVEQMRRDFLANVSHDLRTPLTTLRGALQAIAEGIVTDPEETRASARMMLGETLRMIRLVNTLVDLSRIQSGSLELRIEPVDVAPFVEDLLVPFLVRAEERGVTLTASIPSDLPPLPADRDRLEQVLRNLLDNALKFVEPGGRVEVSASYDREARAIALHVTDDGPGIAPEDLPHIWDRFYKGDKSRSRWLNSGEGLGLVIVKDLVEAHGGRARVQSGDDGTTFTVLFPVKPPKKPRAADHPSAADRSPAS